MIEFIKQQRIFDFKKFFKLSTQNFELELYFNKFIN